MKRRSNSIEREKKKREKTNSRIANLGNPQPIEDPIDGLIGMWYPLYQRAIFIADWD